MNGLGLPGLVEVLKADGSSFKWGQTDLAHPLFEGLFELEPSLVSPDFQQVVSTNSTGTAVGIIQFSNGSPFMIETRLGRGRAILLLSSPDPDWSSLFRSGIFPPLMVSGAAYLSGIGTSGKEYQLITGRAGQLSFNGRPGSESFEVSREDWSSALAVETGASGYVLRIPALTTPGVFNLRQGTRTIGVITANIPPHESHIARTPADVYENILGGKITRLGESDDVKSAIVEGRFGRELWKLCLYIALAALLAEMLIGRVGKREAAVTA
jgi:hypothetical protein